MAFHYLLTLMGGGAGDRAECRKPEQFWVDDLRTRRVGVVDYWARLLLHIRRMNS